MVDIPAICVILQFVPFRKVVQRVLYAQRPGGDTFEAAPGAVETSRIGQRRCPVPFELVPRDALKVSAGTFAAGVAFVAEQAKRDAKPPREAAAGLSGSALGTLFALQSRRAARPIDAPHTRCQGEGRLHLSHGARPEGHPVLSLPAASLPATSRLQFGQSVVSRSFMVRDDTAIPRTEQGQLSTDRGAIILHLRPVACLTAGPAQPDRPILCQTLDNANSANEDTNRATSREVDSERFWAP